MNLKAIQEAIRTLWVLPASGLADGAVFFSHPESAAPPQSVRPCVSIWVGAPERVGLDQVSRDFDPAGAAGQEIIYRASGPRELQVMLQAFSSSANGLDAASDARALLSKIETSLSLPNIRSALNAAAIGVLRHQPAQWVPGIARAGWEGRATLETIFCVSETVEARIGYIQSVSGTRTVDDSSTPYTLIIED